MKLRVLLVPSSASGSVATCITLATRLLARGHEPVLLTASAARPVDVALPWRSPTPEAEIAFTVAAWTDPRSMAKQFLTTRDAIAALRPDVVVTDTFTVGAGLAARAAGALHATLGLAAFLFPVAGAPTIRPEIAQKRAERSRHITASLAAVARAIGLRDDPWLTGPEGILGDAFFLRSTPTLQGNADVLPEAVTFVGALLDTARNGIECDHVAIQAEKLFDFRDLFPTLFGILGDLEFPTVASLGPLATRYGAVPSNVSLRIVDPCALACGARIMINTGHTTSTLAALVHGVPLVILDYGSGADEIGLRCAAAGAAIVLSPSTATREELRAAVLEAATSPRMRMRARAIGEELAARDGFAEIIAVLEARAACPRRTERASVA